MTIIKPKSVKAVLSEAANDPAKAPRMICAGLTKTEAGFASVVIEVSAEGILSVIKTLEAHTQLEHAFMDLKTLVVQDVVDAVRNGKLANE